MVKLVIEVKANIGLMLVPYNTDTKRFNPFSGITVKEFVHLAHEYEHESGLKPNDDFNLLLLAGARAISRRLGQNVSIDRRSAVILKDHAMLLA